MKEPLLKQGPREAPEPETAEERSRRLGMKTAGGGVVAGGLGLAKAGLLGKFFVWWFVWHGAFGVWRAFGFAGLAVLIGVIAAYFVVKARQEAR